MFVAKIKEEIIEEYMHIGHDHIGTFLLDSGLVSEADIKEARKKSTKGGVEQILLAENKITADDVRRMQAYMLGVSCVDLKKRDIDFSVLSLIPEPIARNHNIVAFRNNEGVIDVAMLDLKDISAIDFIKKTMGLKVVPHLTDEDSMRQVLLAYQKALKEEFGDVIQSQALLLRSIEERAQASDAKQFNHGEDASVTRMVDALLRHAVMQRATDIHIEPFENELLVRYRIDGVLRDAMMLPIGVAEALCTHIKTLAHMVLDEKHLAQAQDGRFKRELAGEQVNFRVSTIPVFYGEKIVVRIFRENAVGFTLEALGFHGRSLEHVYEALRSTSGMVFVVGPAGSGQTTTLYTLLELLNTPEVNISTVEDPVEHQMHRVNQMRIQPEIGLTFSHGLRALMRQDPDVVMVSEIRDSETANIALNTALSGRLVLSGLHSTSAVDVVSRLVDLGMEPSTMSQTCKAVVAQRLVRRLTSSKQKYTLSKAELKALREKVDLDRVLAFLQEEEVVGKKADWMTIPFYKPSDDGLTEGYRGQIGIQEVLLVGHALKDMMARGGTSEEIVEYAKKDGMMTLLEDGVFKAVQGVTSLEEVFRVVAE